MKTKNTKRTKQKPSSSLHGLTLGQNIEVGLHPKISNRQTFLKVNFMIFIVSPTLEDQREMHFFFFIELKNLAAMLSIIIQRS